MEDMSLDRPSSSNETSDRISQLPDHIILRILFFLPAKDVVRSSILSKTWLSVWKSLPIFSFSSDASSLKANLLEQDAFCDAEDDGDMDLIDAEDGYMDLLDASFDAEADGYMDLIEKSLEKLRHHKALQLRSRFTAEYIQEMVAKSPLLQILILKPYSLEGLKISSPSLQILFIYAAGRGVGEKEIEIDAPNLRRYQFNVAKGKPAATPVFINSARLQVAELSKQLLPGDLLGTWFHHLMDCLPSFEYNALRISVWADMTNKDIVLGGLRRISTVPPVYLDVLSVVKFCRPFDFASFFNCCFWICRPKTIIIKTSCKTTADLKDQLQHGKLIPWGKNPACCINFQRKCWKHYLDGVKFGGATKMKDDYYASVCHEAGIGLTSSEVVLIAIHLRWKITGQKRNQRWGSLQNSFQQHGFKLIFP
ncbi:hypothetical protein V6N13_132874 [Hibiscus sabdariffa]